MVLRLLDAAQNLMVSEALMTEQGRGWVRQGAGRGQFESKEKIKLKRRPRENEVLVELQGGPSALPYWPTMWERKEQKEGTLTRPFHGGGGKMRAPPLGPGVLWERPGYQQLGPGTAGAGGGEGRAHPWGQ